MLNAHGVLRPVVALSFAGLALAAPVAYGQGKTKIEEISEQTEAASKAGDWARMEKLADAGLELHPANIENFWASKGLAALNQGRAADAEPSLKKAVEIKPEWAAIWDQLGKAQRLQKKFDDALVSGRKAVTLDSTSALAYENLGHTYSDKGLVTEAIMAFETAIELAPKSTDAMLGLGFNYNKAKRYDDALRVLTQAAELAPEDSLIQYQIGNVHLSQREYKEAIPFFEKALKFHPDYPKAMEAMARCYRELGDVPNAIRCYEALLKMNPDDKRAAAELAKIRAKGEAPPAAPSPPDPAPASAPAAPAGGRAVMPVEYKNEMGTRSQGYINANGTLVVQGLRRARHFSEGLAEAVPIVEGSYDEVYGFIDPAGNFVVKPQFSGTTPFHCGLAAVQPKGQYKWGYVDRSGNLAIPAQFEQAEPFSCDIARVNNGDGWRYIDKTGKTLFADAPFKDGETFSDGLACANVPVPPEKQSEYHGCRRLYIDPSGKPAIEKVFWRTTRFSEGMAFVTLVDGGKEKTGFIDKTGKLVIDLTGKFTDVRPFSEGMACVRNKEGHWGFIDTTGKVIVEPKYSEYSDDFHEGLACVVLSDPYRVGYIDKTGKEVIPLVKGSTSRYGEAGWIFCIHDGSFRGGLAHYGDQIIDRTGKVVWPK